MPGEILRHCGWILLVAGLVFFANLGAARLWDRDEPRNAGCALEMLQRADWVVPVFNDELRTHKPVLLYWFMMAAYALFGVNEFAARFWSAALGIGTVLMTYHLGRRLFHAQAGLWGALALATCIMFPLAARAATPDSVLIFFTTLATLLYVLGSFPAGPTQATASSGYLPRSWPWAAAMYGAMGLAVLAKGPVGAVLPTAIIGMFLLLVRLPPSDRPGGEVHPRGFLRRAVAVLRRALRPFAPLHFLRTCWAMRPITALAVILAVALPWYLAVGLRTQGEWLRGFFLVHNLGRALEPMESHSGTPLYYPAVLLVAYFPWSVFAVPLLIDLVARLRHRDSWHAGYLFLACWGAVYPLLFTLARTKLPSYITPAYPAYALLTGALIYHWTRGEARARPFWFRLAFMVLAVVGAGMLVAIPILARRLLPGEEWLGLVGIVLLIGAVAAGVALHRGRPDRAAIALVAMSWIFALSFFGVATVRVDRHQRFDRFLAEVRQRSASPRLAAFGLLEPSWVFYHRRPIRLFEEHQAGDLRALLASDRDAYAITTVELYQRHKASLPAESEVLAREPLFLQDEELVLIGRR